MALFNYATKEITLKIVYYGPGLSGKTTNLQYLHSVLNTESKGKLLSLSTEADRTLFFDFLPVELGKIKDFSIRFQLYTVPGQVRYNATRKVVLKGADAVVFVADSQIAMKEQNIESFVNMRENLLSNNINPDAIPIVLQYNKRDLQNILSIDELNSDLNKDGKYDYLEASAINGTGVEDAFKLITKLVLKDISKKHKVDIQPSEKVSKGVDTNTVAFKADSEKAKVTHIRHIETPEQELPFTEPTVKISEETEMIPEAKHPEKGIKESEKEIKKHVEFKTETKPGIPSTEIREVPVVSEEKINTVLDEIRSLSKTTSDLISAVQQIRDEISFIKDSISQVKDDRATKEIRNEQKEIKVILNEILDMLNQIKTKKSWFRL